jgi:hypothetical protein
MSDSALFLIPIRFPNDLILGSGLWPFKLRLNLLPYCFKYIISKLFYEFKNRYK